jgi:protein PhnA
LAGTTKGGALGRDDDPRLAEPATRDRCANADQEEHMEVKDSNGNLLQDGDSVQIVKDLKVKGSSVTLKRGTIVKNIRLTDDEGEVECNADKVKGLVLKTCFLKKV